MPSASVASAAEVSGPSSPATRTELGSAPSRPSFRHDIEGLRAVTALLVAGFHIWGNKVSGGVDVFFVVSGYFITLTLVGHIVRYGRVRPGLYLARLGQRLGPMALLVLAVTIAIAWFVLPGSRRESDLEQVIASLVSSENLLLAMQSIDYLAQDEPKSAVQQFWAMSVQGQFYLAWLALALAATWLAARSAWRGERWLTVLVAVVVGASFAWSLAQTHHDQAFAYFSPLTRVWEFGVGALIALLASRVPLPHRIRVLLVWTGLAGIITCAAFVPVESSFPGAAALWPVLAAALILLSGSKGEGLTENAMLSHPLLVAMGGFAFAIYLWHWPLLIAARSMLGSEELGWRSGTAVLLGAVVLAWASSRWIERPAIQATRSASALSRRRAGVVLVVAWVAVASTAATLLVSVRVAEAQEQARTAALLADGPGTCVGAAALVSGTPDCVNPELEGKLFPEAGIARDLARPDLECAVKKWHARAQMCAYGAVGSDRRIALIGNSHAVAWFPALERIATEEGWELRVWYKTGCTFSTPQREGTNPRLAAECDEWVANVQADILAGPAVSWAVTSTHQASKWAEADGTVTESAADAAFMAAWSPLIERGTEIVVLRDYPRSSDASLACVDRSGVEAVELCAEPRTEVADGVDQMWRSASGRIEGAHGLDLTNAFCDGDRCYATAGHVRVYRDRSHISNTYASTLASPIHDALRGAGLVDAVDSQPRG